MKNLAINPFRFFSVMGDIQAYLNVFYLVVAFPLCVFYLVFLVTGLSLGLSTLIIWVGLPILLLVCIGWCALASFERYMAIHWLKRDLPAVTSPSMKNTRIWTRFKNFFANPLTWKSMIYLFLKFPLGMATFVVVITLVSLTLVFLTAPITYKFLPGFEIAVFLGPDLPVWHIDTMYEAIMGMLFGLVLWPLTLQVTNGLAWAHAKLAQIMLGNGSVGEFAKILDSGAEPNSIG